jgi:hypothetical protein
MVLTWNITLKSCHCDRASAHRTQHGSLTCVNIECVPDAFIFVSRSAVYP